MKLQYHANFSCSKPILKINKCNFDASTNIYVSSCVGSLRKAWHVHLGCIYPDHIHCVHCSNQAFMSYYCSPCNLFVARDSLFLQRQYWTETSTEFFQSILSAFWTSRVARKKKCEWWNRKLGLMSLMHPLYSAISLKPEGQTQCHMIARTSEGISIKISERKHEYQSSLTLCKVVGAELIGFQTFPDRKSVV